jgi:hypothetical protein
MTIKNNQINSNFHQIAVTDADGQVTAIQAGGVVLADAANLTIGGGSNGQVLATDGAGNLSWATVDTGNVANAGYANIAGEAYSVDGANVSGQVANAAVADSAGSAESVALANVVGAGSVAAIDLNGALDQYLNGAGQWVEVEQGDPAAVSWLAEVNTDLGSPTFPVPAAFAGTVREVADASALTAALTAAADGDVIKLTADITLASTLTVSKAVKFTGGFALQSAASTAAPVTLISVTAAAYFDDTITIKHRKTNNTSVECAVNVNAVGFVSDARVEFMEFGYIVRGSFSISGSTAYTGALGNSHRHIAVYSVTAPSQIDGVQFEFPQEATARANLIFMGVSVGTDKFDSLLKVSNCSHDLAKYCRQFLFIETLATTGRTASLWASQNSFNALNGGIGMTTSTGSPFDQFAAIVLYKNYEGTAAEGNYKGVMFIDGSGTVRSIGAPTVLAVADNQGPSILRADYTYAVASAIAIKNTVYTKPAALTPTFGQTILDSIGRDTTTINMAATSATVAVSGNVVVGITSSGMTVTGVVSGTSFTGNGANLANITGANVSGQVANAASADVALSVAGANVSGAVANATFATSADSAVTATTATNAGTAASATFATSAGSATVADSANSVALANVVGAGNIASINLNGNAGQVLAGDGSWATVASGDANYANFAGEAYSVSGSNVTGQVANAASADIALAVGSSNAQMSIDEHGCIVMSNAYSVTNPRISMYDGKVIIGEGQSFVPTNTYDIDATYGPSPQLVKYANATGGSPSIGLTVNGAGFVDAVITDVYSYDYFSTDVPPSTPSQVDDVMNITGTVTYGGTAYVEYYDEFDGYAIYLSDAGGLVIGVGALLNGGPYVDEPVISWDGTIARTANPPAYDPTGEILSISGEGTVEITATYAIETPGSETVAYEYTGDTYPVNTLLLTGAGYNATVNGGFVVPSLQSGVAIVSAASTEVPFVGGPLNFSGVITTAGENAIAIGFNAGSVDQGNTAIAIGNAAGKTQGAGSVAIGNKASGNGVGSIDAVAIGNNAGMTSQGQATVAIGLNAGMTSQGSSTVAIGQYAGQTSQRVAAVAIGLNAGQSNQGLATVAIGRDSGVSNQSNNAVAVGYFAGRTNQGANAIAIGSSAGLQNQGTNSISIGERSGNGSANTISIGSNAGPGTQGVESIAIGTRAGKYNTAAYTQQGANSVAVGSFTAAKGYRGVAIGDLALNEGNAAVSVGCGAISISEGSIAVGDRAAVFSGSTNAIAIGTTAFSEYINSIAIGSGAQSRSGNTIVIGANAGPGTQGVESIAIGTRAGKYSSGTYTQGANSVAVGSFTAAKGYRGVAIGDLALNEGNQGVSVGYAAISLGEDSIAIGRSTVFTSSVNGIAIGTSATSDYVNGIAIGASAVADPSSGTGNAIAIGSSAQSRSANSIVIGANAIGNISATNSITLNATGDLLENITADSFVVKPVRDVTGNAEFTVSLYYNPTTGEIGYKTV